MELLRIFKPDSVIVSTDSEEIATAVQELGLTVPFMRPAQLADDYTGTVPVISHALKWYEDNVAKVDYVVAVYPTAILLNIEDILDSFGILRNSPSCDSVLSAASFPYPIQRAVFENGEGYAEMFQPQYFHSRSQDLVRAMHDAGQFSVSRAAAVREGKVLTELNVKLKTINRNKVIDIDDYEDVCVAEDKLRIHMGV